jgi:hypothetical protein
VAALGLSLRTVAQLLEKGQLDEVVAAQRAQAGARPEGGQSEGRREPRGGSGAGGRGERPAGNSRPNPFARPSKPVAVAEEPAGAPAEEAPAAGAGEAGAEASHELSTDSAEPAPAPGADPTSAEA